MMTPLIKGSYLTVDKKGILTQFAELKFDPQNFNSTKIRRKGNYVVRLYFQLPPNRGTGYLTWMHNTFILIGSRKHFARFVMEPVVKASERGWIAIYRSVPTARQSPIT